MEKAYHYNDRKIRGKLEAPDSVMKRVSTNLIISKRESQKWEFMLNPELVE